MRTFVLKVVHPFVISGRIVAAGSLVEMAEHDARMMLERGRAVLATADDEPKAKAGKNRAQQNTKESDA
jgi:hypothetical protein